VLSLANAILYHWAGRAPASPFFHYPEYLPSSPLAAEATAALQKALADGDTGAVMVSREHMELRLPQPLLDALWQRWSPVARFGYPYQRDLFLFLDRQRLSPAPASSAPLATFAPGIELRDVTVERLAPDVMLVRLDWRAPESPAENLVVFVHLEGNDGLMSAQHDGVPVTGFRPTTSWQAGELITDWHWLAATAGIPPAGKLRIGLYRPEDGQRQARVDGGQPADAYEVALDSVLAIGQE
jgi:hypothetical protein